MFGLKILKAPYIGRVPNTFEEIRINKGTNISSKKISTHCSQIPILLVMVIFCTHVCVCISVEFRTYLKFLKNVNMIEKIKKNTSYRIYVVPLKEKTSCSLLLLYSLNGRMTVVNISRKIKRKLI